MNKTKNNNKIYISTSSFGEYDPTPINKLKEKGWKVDLNPFGKTMTEDQIKSVIGDIDGLIAGTEPLSAGVFEVAKKLKVISRVGVGMDQIDMDAAKKRNIRVFNTPDGPTAAVAELTVGLILALLRKICRQDSNIREGIWKKEMGTLLMGKCVGIIGLGKIGKYVAGILSAFGCKIIYFDLHVEASTEGYCKMPLTDVLNKSDIVSLHLPYSKENHHLINESTINEMKKGAFLINASRGGLVDEKALHAALKNGKLAGAGMDTFEKEPYDGPLKELDNVVLTPHIGSYAKEERIKMEIQAVENLLEGINERSEIFSTNQA